MRSIPLIPPEHKSRLEQLLFNLQHYILSKSEEETKGPQSEEEAQLQMLEEYLDKLYDDDIIQKVQGTRAISILADDPYNIEPLLNNESLLKYKYILYINSAVARTLKEEYMKNMDLTTNIVTTFRSFSHYSETHPILNTYRIYDTLIKIINLEIKRYDINYTDLKKLDKKSIEYEKERKKFKIWKKKQENLIGFCLHTLINLSEDNLIEMKCVKKGIIDSLICLLNRTNPDLLLYVLLFLRRLSLVRSNIDILLDRNIIDVIGEKKIMELDSTESEAVLEVLMRFVYNISFEPKFRQQMKDHDFIKKVTDLMRRPQFRQVSFMYLYNMSQDDNIKPLFSKCDGMLFLCECVLNFPKPQLARELAALLVNVTWSIENVDFILNKEYFKPLLAKAIKSQDSLLMKSIRNITEVTRKMQDNLEKDKIYKYKGMWSKYIGATLKLLTNKDISQDLQLELLGIMSNITPEDIAPKYYIILYLYIERDGLI